MPGVPGEPFPTERRPPRVNGRFVSTKKYNQLKGLNRTGSKKKIRTNVNQESDVMPAPSMRRLVNISHLAASLYCSRCNSHLYLEDITNERQRGLVSKFTICCRECRYPQEICTEQKVERYKFLYPVNMKLALGMIDGGVGATHINSILSSLNVPTVAPSLLQRHENVVGPAIHTVATESCIQAAEYERSLTLADFGTEAGFTCRADSSEMFTTETWENIRHVIPVTVSADMGWQKRGNGYKYDSQTGTSSLIGHHSGKIIAYQLMSVTCRQCEKKQQPCMLPTCRRNHEGSAKSMEAAAAVLMCNSDTLKKANICVGTLVGDEDSCTAKRIRDEFGGKIERASDLMHSQKSLGRALYKIRDQHKEMTTKVIGHFKAMFGTAIKKNKGNVEAVRKNILAIPEHAFGNHSQCSDWCDYAANPETYHSKYFQGLGNTQCPLYMEVKKVFVRLSNFSSQLAPCGSTQNNESFNMIVASKAPKARHYGSSASLSYRLDAAASQKNLGVKYIQEVNKTLLISPGETGNMYRAKVDI
ncbi:UNVERIFIED_CONTAM: hypothetical protein B566_EDAN018654 [Ephemera danica]|nr:hypothetical protein B566_EDAN018654 [Ephemera danica]